MCLDARLLVICSWRCRAGQGLLLAVPHRDKAEIGRRLGLAEHIRLEVLLQPHRLTGPRLLQLAPREARRSDLVRESAARRELEAVQLLQIPLGLAVSARL